VTTKTPHCKILEKSIQQFLSYYMHTDGQIDVVLFSFVGYLVMISVSKLCSFGKDLEGSSCGINRHPGICLAGESENSHCDRQ
jgi:hypothetical protein